MNHQSQLSDFQLLQGTPHQLLEKYQKAIKKIVQLHIEKSIYGQLSRAILLEGVQKRLPQYIQYLYQRQGKHAAIKTVLYEACRMLCQHLEDIDLLQKQSKNLVVKYRPLIYARIHGFVNADKLREEQVEDIAQYVLERLLKKFDKGGFQYTEGRALFRTYFYQVINYTIIDGLRRLHTSKANIGQSVALNPSHVADTNIFSKVSNKLDLEQQSGLYGKLLQLFKIIDRHKFELSAKVSCAIVLQNRDVHALPLEENTKIELLVHFWKNYTTMSKEILWKTLVEFTNLLERKNIGTLGLQKWFLRRRNWTIVKILYIVNFDGRLQKKLTEMEKQLLAKISDRTVGKFAEEYFGEIVYVYYR